MRATAQALAFGLSLAPAALAWAGFDAFWSEEWPGEGASLVVLQAAAWVALAGLPVVPSSERGQAARSQPPSLAWTDVLLALPCLAVGASFDRARGLWPAWPVALVALGMAACLATAAARESQGRGRRAQWFWLGLVAAPAALSAALWVAYPTSFWSATWRWLEASPVTWTLAQSKPPASWWSLAAPLAVCLLHLWLSGTRNKGTSS